ncbi:MAG: ThiF family adenylyltransferase [Deltaproteobacteria bacterium]
MTGHRITLLGSQNRMLQEWLCRHPEGHERGAIVLFRRLARSVNDQPQSDRFLAVKVIIMSGDWVLESSATHLKINMRKLSEIYHQCEANNLEFGFVHNHPNGYPDFSPTDDVNEHNILHGLSGCNGPNAFFVAMILRKGNWSARIRQGKEPGKVIPVKHISIVSDRMELHGIVIPDYSTEILERQGAAFGKPFNAMLQSLRVAIVGVGGTGSPVATLLARAGVGELILIDGDDLDKSNLNRVRGYRYADVGKKKAHALAVYLRHLGLNVSVSSINSILGESGEAVDALSSADVIMGCTDDQAGRDIMNQAMYYHAQVYIDVGLTGRIGVDSNGHPYLRDHRGRVSCVLPESGACLRCQRVVTDQMLQYEQRTKENPELVDLDPVTLKREYYLTGGGEQAPGIGPFTSATADNAVATLMNLIKPYRDISPELRPDNIWIDFVHMNIHSNAPTDDPECIYCRKHLLLLKSEGKYRLEMPKLGEIKTNV